MTKKQESEAGNDKPSRRGETSGVKKNAAERTPAKSKKFVPTDDSIFKEFMTEKDLAIEWIQEYLPWLADLLNLNELKIDKGEYYDDEIRKRFTDVAYSIPFLNAPGWAELLIILEHKKQGSRKDLCIAIAQALTYLANQCLKAARNGSAGKRIPQPIPVIVYTGANPDLEPISWGDAFPLPPVLGEYALGFRPVFLNMTRMRLEGRLPENPFLKILYNTMTRHSVRDLDGFEETEFQPLKSLPTKLSSQSQKRVNSLLVLYSTRIKVLPPEERRERFEKLYRSVNLEEKMGKDVLYEFFAPKAREWGKEEGIVIGQKKEREEILTSQRQTLSATISERFGSCPTALKRALGKIRDVDALFNLRLFAVTEAQSVDELLERAKGAAQ